MKMAIHRQFSRETYRKCSSTNDMPSGRMKIRRISVSPSSDLICLAKSIVFTFIIVLLLSNSPQVNGKLTLSQSKQCGEIVCKTHYYCSRVDDSCRPCQEVCDKASSNYDQDLCEKDCQDYIHDLLYMRKSLMNHSDFEDEKVRLYYDDIQGELLTLKILLMITIVISTGVMIALFFLVWYLKRGRNRLGISNPNWCGGKDEDTLELPVIYSNAKCFSLPLKNSPGAQQSATTTTNNLNNNASSRASTPDVVSRSVGSHPGSVLSVNKLPYVDPPTAKVKQQRFRREPSESTLPEYLGYDNPAMAPSPTHL